jgi:PhnB protein
MHVQPYLFFEGRCEEAAEFYCRTLGAEITLLMRYKDCPEPPQDDPSRQESCGTAGNPDKIMHMTLKIGATTLFASDGRCQGKPQFQGFSLSLDLATEAQAQSLFKALAEEGQVQMPLAKTFFASSFGMVTDRFGIPWMIIVAP